MFDNLKAALKYTPLGDPLSRLSPAGIEEYRATRGLERLDFWFVMWRLKTRDYFWSLRKHLWPQLKTFFYVFQDMFAGGMTEEAQDDKYEAERPELESWLGTPVQAGKLETIGDLTDAIHQATEAGKGK